MVTLAADSEAKHRDEYALNKALRAKLRASKKEDAALDKRRQELGLAEGVKLLPEHQGDAEGATLAMFAGGEGRFVANWQGKRQRILSQSIFDNAGGGAGGSGDVRGSRNGGSDVELGVLSKAAAAAAAKTKMLQRAAPGGRVQQQRGKTLLQKAAQQARQRG